MTQHHRAFGIDLASSCYELHPHPRDNPETNELAGNYCANIKFNETIANQLMDFVSANDCYVGMEIGSLQLESDKGGIISFEKISRNLSKCTLSVTKEQTVSYNEVYETVYDRPPSNAMFLRRKGFVHSKLSVKPTLCSSELSANLVFV